jgi:hypothetical protein
LKILKSRPHNRVCVSCGAVNTVYTLCKKCKLYKQFIHYNDYKIVYEFYSFPDLLNLKNNFNIKSIKSVLAILKSLKVPVSNYTLRYLIFNRDKFLNYTYRDITNNFYTNFQSNKFKLFFHFILPDKSESNYYSNLYSDIYNGNKPLLTISKEYSIPYETVHIYKRIIHYNEITY